MCCAVSVAGDRVCSEELIYSCVLENNLAMEIVCVCVCVCVCVSEYPFGEGTKYTRGGKTKWNSFVIKTVSHFNSQPLVRVICILEVWLVLFYMLCHPNSLLEKWSVY